MDLQKKTGLTVALLLVVMALWGNYLRFFAPPPGRPFDLDGNRLEDRDVPDRPELLDDDFLRVLGAREVSYRTYHDPAGPVSVFLGYFDRQKEGSQVHSPEHCYPGSGWSIVAKNIVKAPWGGDRVRKLVVTDGIERQVVYYWFQTDERVLNGVFELKYHLTKAALLHRPQDVVFARISAGMGDDAPAAESLVASYAVDVERVVERMYRSRHEPD